MKNTMTDVTNLSDAALDVVLAVRSGEDFVDCAHLTTADRAAVIEALGAKLDARTIAWIAGPSGNVVARGPRTVASDVEGMILDRQDREENGEY